MVSNGCLVSSIFRVLLYWFSVRSAEGICDNSTQYRPESKSSIYLPYIYYAIKSTTKDDFYVIPTNLDGAIVAKISLLAFEQTTIFVRVAIGAAGAAVSSVLADPPDEDGNDNAPRSAASCIVMKRRSPSERGGYFFSPVKKYFSMTEKVNYFSKMHRCLYICCMRPTYYFYMFMHITN